MFLPRINALSYCIISIEGKCRYPISTELSDINLGNMKYIEVKEYGIKFNQVFSDLIGIVLAKN